MSGAVASPAAAALVGVADAVLERRVEREPLLALGVGRAVAGLPSLGADGIDADVAFYGGCLARLAGLDAATLSASERAFLGALEFDLRQRVEAARHRLLDFVVMPYRGGDLHAEAREALAACDGDSPAGREQRRRLLNEYVRLIDEMTARTVEQRERGILLSSAAVMPARSALDALVDGADDAVRPALRRLRAVLDDDYQARAPRSVGLGAYAGGAEAYRGLVAARADTELAADAIHAIGLEQMAELEEAKASLHARIGRNRSRADFERELMRGPAWIAADAAAVEACFRGYLARLAPELPRWFGRLPAAPWDVARADPAIEAAMSYGYYERPTPARPVGRYRYNGSRLGERSLVGAQHLIYHELVPGHHLQLALQAERAKVHPLQAHLQSMAAVEGWAVYASELAREMGLYEDFELYGHYVMQSFLAARLVVDTGLNALGWSLARARAYLREHTLESDALIDAELLRYSTDIPAQALAYDLGRRAIDTARRGAAERLGSDFDVRAFHDVVLEVGGFPLPVLAGRVAEWSSAR